MLIRGLGIYLNVTSSGKSYFEIVQQKYTIYTNHDIHHGRSSPLLPNFQIFRVIASPLSFSVPSDVHEYFCYKNPDRALYEPSSGHISTRDEYGVLKKEYGKDLECFKEF